MLADTQTTKKNWYENKQRNVTHNEEKRSIENNPELTDTDLRFSI